MTDKADRSITYQTLDRGLVVLGIIASSPEPMSISSLTEKLEFHRSIVYRIVRTLENHNLVQRTRDDLYVPGFSLLTLAGYTMQKIQPAISGVLTQLADRVESNAALVLGAGDEAVRVMSVDASNSPVQVSYRVGMRHPLNQGASGVAILSGREPEKNERPQVTKAREQGYARSEGEVERGMTAIAAPVRVGAQEVNASVSVLFLNGDIDEVMVAEAVIDAATQLAPLLAYKDSVPENYLP